jgi:hypothetical protein
MAPPRLHPMLIDDTDRGLGIRTTRKNRTLMWRCNYRPNQNPCPGVVYQVGENFAEHHPHLCNPKSHYRFNMVVASSS